jgi:isoquinoline 1-oxidoreductase beta subunit
MAKLTRKATDISRRQFLKSTGLASGGLVVAFHLPACGFRGSYNNAESIEKPWSPNAFVRIAGDNQITVLVNQAEMGQGVHTSLPMLVAEELDADWSTIAIELAPVTPEYHHAFYGMRSTGGSSSILSSWQPLRNAGAMARILLVNAAAEQWGVDVNTLRTENAQVIHKTSGRTAKYGSLTEYAAGLPTPEKVKLKDPEDFILIGTDVNRIEGSDKVTGKAQYSLDIQLPGMLTAVVAHPPVYGDSVKHYQAEKALKVPGVIKVKAISTGVAVIAKDFWTAKMARDQLQIEWSQGPATGLSTAKLQQQFRELAEQPGTVVEAVGDLDTTLASADKTLEALYELPYLAHAAMEPLNCVAQVGKGHCELWVGTQAQSKDQLVVAKILGIKPEQVTVNGTLMGGSFGRRYNQKSDFVADAAEVANGETVPIKTVWTREEDIQGGYYRPMFTHKAVAGLNKKGMPVTWFQRLVGQSIMTGSLFESAMVKDGVDYLSVDGATNMPYDVVNRRIELHGPEIPMPVLWWRSVSHTHNAYVRECFLDEIAHANYKDPLELRRALLSNQPRHLQVLELASEKAGWRKPIGKGRALGIAVHASFRSYVAQVAEVSVTNANEVKVHRVVCAVDCGIAVNPLNIKAQIEGAIIFGLSAALYGEITLENGKVQQSNFHDYPVLRMNAMPEIEVHIVKSDEQPTGIGEPGVPPIAPAVANALFRLTGKRVRKLPIQL